MNAVYYEKFAGQITVEQLPDPALPPHGAIIKVEASGLCRSDWHGWMGHDGDIQLPHVPGHEFAGRIVAIDQHVRGFKEGDRVTVPFSMGCGSCPTCIQGDHQVCDDYYQPGFTGWGSFAEYVAIPYATQNLVHLPEDMTYLDAAILGCRFMTAYRGITCQAGIKPGQWITVFGCGGVGLSAIMIAKAMGALPIAVDISAHALNLARDAGALHTILTTEVDDLPAYIKEITGGGAHVGMDAIGHAAACAASIEGLRKRGKHIQVGLLKGLHEFPKIPMGNVIANELEIIGSHGMQAYRYPEMLQFIQTHRLPLHQLIHSEITLAEVPQALMTLDLHQNPGIKVMTIS